MTANPAVLEVPARSSAETVITLDPGKLSDTIWQGVVTFQTSDPEHGRKVLVEIEIAPTILRASVVISST